MVMGLITTYTATIAVLNFLILWFGIYFLDRWIPPGEDIPIWKAGVIAAVITVFAMLFVGWLVSLVSPA